MKAFGIFIISILLTQSLGQDEQPQKYNLVTGALNKLLDPVFEQLSTQNFSKAELDLGEGVGKFFNLVGRISGGATKQLRDNGAFGFRLNTTLSRIILTGMYDIQHLDILKLFPIYGKGNFDVAIDLINLNMVVGAKYDVGSEMFKFTVSPFNLTAGESKVRFDSLMDDPNVTDFLNELISALVPDLATTLNEPLQKQTEHFAGVYGNGIINCIRTQITRLKECIEGLFKPSEDVAELLPSKLDDIVTELVKKYFV